MLQLTLYNFSKRHNSTALPAGAGSVVGVVLKRETSLNAPIFLLQGDLPSVNYCAFNGAYYFIDDIVSVRDNLYELRCTLDVLATLRSDILATSAFVEYATGGNNQIPDTRLAVEYGVGGVEVSSESIFAASLNLAGGSKYISVLGQTGTETYYIADSNLRLLFASIANWSEGVIDRTSLETILDTGLRQLVGSGSAADCIRDAYILPCGPVPEILSGAENIYLGMFNTGISGNRITGSGDVSKITNIAIPHHYTDWRRQAPYEVCQLFLPLFGTINIPSDIAADSDELTIESRLNVRSGDFTYYVSGAGRNGKEITVGGNCAASLAVGASNINVGGAFGSIAGGFLNAASGNIAGAAASTLSILSPAPQSVGATGGLSNKYPNGQCIVYYRNTSDGPAGGANSQGLPLFATRQLSTLSGYVKTRGASVGGAHRDILREHANALLDSGVFLE